MSFRASFYSTLYDKFASLQPEGLLVVRLAYPGRSSNFPELRVYTDSAIVLLPRVLVWNDKISYGTCSFKEDQFGMSSSVRLILASAVLVGTKAIFYWLYKTEIANWIKSKGKRLRAAHATEIIFDAQARRRIEKVSGDRFYAKILSASDILSFCALPELPLDIASTVNRLMLGSYLSKSWARSTTFGKIGKAAASILQEVNNTMPDQNETLLATLCEARLKGDLEQVASSWDEFMHLADTLYSILLRIPGAWRSSCFAYSNVIGAETSAQVTQRMVSEAQFRRAAELFKIDCAGSEGILEELYQSMMAEVRAEKMVLNKLRRINTKLNFDSFEFPRKDYGVYLRLHNRLSSEIRIMIQRASVIKNVTDENQFQESGRIDLQIAIQAMASGKNRDDMFIKDEDIAKNEAWSLLIDSSKSLERSSDTLKAIAICLAETANNVMGSKRWGMFAFSDKLQCIKFYDESYDRDAKARIGGLRQEGLSHIPDAMRAVRWLANDFLRDRNYIILVSDGIPSGYPGIEEEFSKSIKEAGRLGAEVGAISLGPNRMQDSIGRSKSVEQQSEIVKAFIDIYNEMSMSGR